MKLTIRTCLLALIVASITVSIAESTAAITESTASSSETISKSVQSAAQAVPAKATAKATAKKTTPPPPTPTAQPKTKATPTTTANQTTKKTTATTTTTLNTAVAKVINAVTQQVSEEDKILEKAKTAFENEKDSTKKALAAKNYWTQLDKALQTVVKCMKVEGENISAYQTLLNNGAEKKKDELAESQAKQKTCGQKKTGYDKIMPDVLKAAHMSIQQVNTELETQQQSMAKAVDIFKNEHTANSLLIKKSVSSSIQAFETQTRAAILQSFTARDNLVETMTTKFGLLTQTHSKEVKNIRSYLKAFQKIQKTWNEAMVAHHAALDSHTGHSEKSGTEEQLSQLSAANNKNTGSIEMARGHLTGATEAAQKLLDGFKKDFRANNENLKAVLDQLAEEYKKQILKVNTDGKTILDVTVAKLDATTAVSQGIQTKMLEAMSQMETVVLKEAQAAETSVETFSKGAKNVVGTPPAALTQFPDAIVSEIVD
jgi:hypothetical protein